ncbi:hypothetical protein ACIU0H_05080 [Pseudomonas aeruginosa]|uniref:hypothetical protein n=1 Tax=Pseudomonas aeruginosa TaxID=287 RepID=UPI00383A088A
MAKRPASAAPGAAVFRDLAYRSRTLILPGGEMLRIEAGRVETDSETAIRYLNDRADFEREE